MSRKGPEQQGVWTTTNTFLTRKTRTSNRTDFSWSRYFWPNYYYLICKKVKDVHLILLNLIRLNLILFHFIPFYSIIFHFIPFYPILSPLDARKREKLFFRSRVLTTSPTSPTPTPIDCWPIFHTEIGKNKKSNIENRLFKNSGNGSIAIC